MVGFQAPTALGENRDIDIVRDRTFMTAQFLKGKTALVTGSTSGIGLGLATALAQQGAHIVLNGFGDHTQAEQSIQSLGVQTV
jgi:FlaA1/EpsC-like NDP-sugar epimerase